MKLNHIIPLLALTLSGCGTVAVSTENGEPISTAVGAPIFQATVTAGATMALRNNPSYVPVAEALVRAIDAAEVGELPITSESIQRFILDVGRRQNLDMAALVLFSTLAQVGFDSYIGTYHPKVVLSSDPQVKVWIAAFRNGLSGAAVFADARG